MSRPVVYHNYYRAQMSTRLFSEYLNIRLFDYDGEYSF